MLTIKFKWTLIMKRNFQRIYSFKYWYSSLSFRWIRREFMVMVWMHANHWGSKWVDEENKSNRFRFQNNFFKIFYIWLRIEKLMSQPLWSNDGQKGILSWKSRFFLSLQSTVKIVHCCPNLWTIIILKNSFSKAWNPLFFHWGLPG